MRIPLKFIRVTNGEHVLMMMPSKTCDRIRTILSTFSPLTSFPFDSIELSRILECLTCSHHSTRLHDSDYKHTHACMYTYFLVKDLLLKCSANAIKSTKQPSFRNSNPTQQRRSQSSLSACTSVLMHVYSNMAFSCSTHNPSTISSPAEQFPQNFPHIPLPEIIVFPGERPRSTDQLLTVTTVAIWPLLDLSDMV